MPDPPAIVALKSQVKGADADPRIWGSYGRTAGQCTWYERRFWWFGWETIPDWHKTPEIPEHVKALPKWKQLFHADHPGLTFFNSTTRKGRTGVSLFGLSLMLYGFYKIKTNVATAKAHRIQATRAEKDAKRRQREVDGHAWWLQK